MPAPRVIGLNLVTPEGRRNGRKVFVLTAHVVEFEGRGKKSVDGHEGFVDGPREFTAVTMSSGTIHLAATDPYELAALLEGEEF